MNKMDMTNRSRLCRLCLCRSSKFIDVLEENGDLGFVVAKTIEDLLQFKVRKVGNYPWVACSTCLEKLIDFKLFKSRCIDSNITFEKRFCHISSEMISGNEDHEMSSPCEVVNEGGRVQEDEEEVAHESEMCQAMMEAETANLHDDNEDEANTLLCNTRNKEYPNSWERNSQDRREEIDIEEGQMWHLKEEPHYAEGDTATDSLEVPVMCKLNSVHADPKVSLGTCMNEPHRQECSGIETLPHIKVDPDERTMEKLSGEDHLVGEGFYCAFCSAVLNTEKNLRDHIAEHEEGRLRNQRARQQQPSKDNANVMCGNPLHASSKACDGPKNARTAIGSLPFTLGSSQNRYYSCNRCSKNFPTYRAFKDHKRDCKSKFLCSWCKKDFVSQSNLSLHLKMNGGANLSCRDCSAIFSYRCELKAHRRQVHTKVFVCKDCHCSFDKNYSLREHVLTHGKVKPLVCNDCQQTFIGSRTLRKHRMEAHNGRSSSGTRC